MKAEVSKSTTILSVLNLLMSAQGLLEGFPTSERLLGSVAQTLKELPGVLACCVCCPDRPEPIGDAFEAAEELIVAMIGVPVDGDGSSVTRPTSHGLRVFRLTNGTRFFGDVLLLLASEPAFEPFEAAAGSFVNSASMILTNRLLQARIESDSRQLEARVKERTAHLAAREERYRSTAERLEAIFSAMNEGVVFQLADGTIETCNESAERILGLSAAQMDGRSSIDARWRAVHEDGSPFPAEVHPAMVALRTGEQVSRVIMGVHKPDGTLSWIAITACPLAKAGKAPHAVVTTFSDITHAITRAKCADSVARKVSETLATAEHHNRLLFDNVSEAVLVCKLEEDALSSRLLDVNDSASCLLSYTREELLRLRVRDVVDPGDDSRTAAAFQRLLAQDRLTREARFISSDGRRIPVEISARCLNLGGSPTLILSVRDISVRKRLQEGLLKSEEKFYRVFMSSPAAIAICDLSDGGRFLEANGGFEAATGYLHEEVIGRTADELGLWVDAGERSECIDIFRKTDRLHRFEHRIRRKNGEIGINMTSVDVIEIDGRPCVISVSIDVTEARRSVAALRAAEQRYRTVADHTYDWEYWQLPDGEFAYVSPSCERITGYSPAEFFDNPSLLDTIVHSDSVSVGVNHTTLPPRERHSGEFKIIRKDGGVRWIGHVCQSVVDSNGEFFGVRGSNRDITQHKRMEEALRKSEEQLSKVFLSTPAITTIANLTEGGRLVAVNEAFERGTGYRREEVLGHPASDFGIWVDPGQFQYTLKQLVAAGRIRDFEYRFRRRSGEVRMGLMSSELIRFDDSLCAISTTIDVTDFRMAEQALRLSEHQHRAILDAAMDGFWIVNSHGRLLEVNEAYCRMSGYSRSELLSMSIPDVEATETEADTAAHLRNVISRGEVRFETRHRRKDGGVIDVEIAVQYRPADGDRLVAFVRDMTGRKIAERQMKTLLTAIEQSHETVVITDLEGRIEYCNPAFEKITGYSKDEAIGQPTNILKSGKHSEDFYRQLWSTVKQGIVWVGQMTNRKKDGSFFEEDVSISPIHDPSGKIIGFVALKRDVTERQHLEEQLRQSQKLESIGRLAGGMAHEFNNLLTVVNGYSGLLRRELQTDRLRSFAKQIEAAGNQGASLTRQLLAFSRKQVFQPRPLDLNHMVTEFALMVQRIIGKNITLVPNLASSLGAVMADPDQIHQVMMNLVLNSRDAMPHGGRIEISTAGVELDESGAAALGPDAVAGRYVTLTVADNGHGMDENTRARLFEPFFTTKDPGKGTGLGLSTVYGIVRQSDGWIAVSTDVGVGTSFRIYLPKIDSTSPSLAGPGSHTEKERRDRSSG